MLPCKLPQQLFVHTPTSLCILSSSHVFPHFAASVFTSRRRVQNSANVNFNFQPASRSFCIAGWDKELTKGYTTLASRTRKELDVKKSRFIAWAAPVDSEDEALAFLAEVRDSRATHNCWAYKIGESYRFNDDGEPGGTAGRPIHSSITVSGFDRVMVVVTRHYGGMKLGTGGLVRAYGGVALDCLREAQTVSVKAKVEIELHVPFELLGALYPMMQSYGAKKLKEDYDVVEGGTSMRLLVEREKSSLFEQAVANTCSGRAKIRLCTNQTKS